MNMEITYEKTESGTKVFVNGNFVGYKCNHCVHGCSNFNEYGVCDHHHKPVSLSEIYDNLVEDAENGCIHCYSDFGYEILRSLSVELADAMGMKLVPNEEA